MPDSTDGTADRPAGTTDELSAMLEEIRTCLREAGPGTGYHQPVQHGHLIALRDAYTPALIAALEAILTDHRYVGRGMCTGCAIDLSDEDEESFSSGAWRSWPCPTYRAITRALLGEGAGDAG